MPEYTERNRKGKDSEIRAQHVISELPFVRSANRTKKNSDEDHDGIDLEVQISGISHLNSVDVQVKSSETGIREAKRKLRERYQLSDDEVEEWLVGQNRIFINAGNTRNEIKLEFTVKVAEICLYNTKQAGGKITRETIERLGIK